VSSTRRRKKKKKKTSVVDDVGDCEKGQVVGMASWSSQNGMMMNVKRE
jgi:hypothetical protein